jgi:acyl-coenzyme A synthetase/AMP-(fatty) acid ligase
MLIRRIYEWARAAPDKTAIIHNGTPFSYRAFALRIEHARNILAQQPLRPGSVAAIATSNMIDGWVIALALRSLGMTTFAVPSLDHLGMFGLKDLGCIVTEAEQESGALPNPRPRNCVIVRIRRGFYLKDPGGELPVPEQMAIVPGAHIVLTSGTTGTYKMVLLPDAVAAIQLPASAALCGFNDRSVVCLFNFGLFAAPSMMAGSVWGLGGAAMIEQRPELYRCLADPTVTYAHTSPAYLSHLLAAPRGAFRPRETLSVGVGGGTLSPAMADEVRTRLTPNLFVHVASTEIGGWCITRIKTAEDLRSHCVAPGCDVQVVDEADRPTAPGQVGQIRIRLNAGSVTEYMDDEAATRAAFRNGFFYPGDVGSFLENGRLVLQGRISDIVNILGKKIAPEPIERALQQRLGAEEVCVVSLPVPGAAEEIHVAIQSQKSIDPAVLAAAWSSAVRGGPQPRFHVLAALPRTETGKVRRMDLREQIRSGAL